MRLTSSGFYIFRKLDSLRKKLIFAERKCKNEERDSILESYLGQNIKADFRPKDTPWAKG